MRLFDAVWSMYLDFVFAAKLAQQECIVLIEKYRFSEAGKAAVSRDGYYDCAMMALKML